MDSTFHILILLSIEDESNDLSEEELEDYEDRIYLWRRAMIAEVFTQQCSREARINVVHTDAQV